MGTMASQITGLTVVYSTVHSGADQRKHQSSASLAFVWGIHRGGGGGGGGGGGEFPAQMASNAENVSIWWRHHVFERTTYINICYAKLIFLYYTLLNQRGEIRRVYYLDIVFRDELTINILHSVTTGITGLVWDAPWGLIQYK